LEFKKLAFNCDFFFDPKTQHFQAFNSSFLEYEMQDFQLFKFQALKHNFLDLNFTLFKYLNANFLDLKHHFSGSKFHAFQTPNPTPATTKNPSN
jgi:hypothetical protein